jgi:putative peptidoglycan binding protein
MRKIESIIAGVALIGLAACGTRPADRAPSGGAMGAGTGAAIGAIAGGVGAIPGALIGGAVGAGAGAATKPQQVNLGEPVWRRGQAAQAPSTTAPATTGQAQTSTASGLPHDQVTQLQVALNQKGFDAGQVDGVYGPQTSAAVQKFQTSQGMPATGQPDAQTLSMLGVQQPPRSSVSSQTGTAMPAS